jgi:pimeloyl-ACP methyl ester carboxylesterase
LPSPTIPSDHYLEVNGLNIHYVDWGGESERNLLLVHGQGGNARNWDHIALQLREEFRVIALDQRGHGESDHTREGYAVTAFASDLARFGEQIGIIPYDLCGASLGARNGIAYAGSHPDHLKHLVCLDYAPEMSVASARNQISGMNQRRLGWNRIDEYVEHQRVSDPRPSDDYYRDQARHALRLNYAGKYVPKHDPEMFWINGGFGVREVPYLWDQWARIRCPILELKGAESDFIVAEIRARMTALQPGLQFVEVPDSGHSVAADNPEFLLRELSHFLVD